MEARDLISKRTGGFIYNSIEDGVIPNSMKWIQAGWKLGSFVFVWVVF
jgi:hypothetical protein